MKLRSTNIDDLDFIFSQEARDEFADLIFRWSKDEHIKNLNDPNKGYFMVENSSQESLGYLILSDLTLPSKSINLTRIVIAKPGKGYGKLALKLIKTKVFEEYKAHRFWLDVFEHNHRARHTYQSVGFKEEGILREVVKRADRYYSQVIMSILEHEYFQQGKEFEANLRKL